MKKKLETTVLSALALTMSLCTLSAPAHAEQRATVVTQPYCVWETWVMSQQGSGIQVTSYAWGQGYNGGACNGAVSPENTVAMDSQLAFKDANTGQIKSCKKLTPSQNWLGGVWNTTNFFGLYFATIPGGGLLSSGAAGLVVPSNELCGPGYYQIEMDACIQQNGSVGWICGPVHTDWQYMNLPNP